MSAAQVVLIEGWAGTPRVWDGIMPGLRAAGFSCRTLCWLDALERPEAAVDETLAQAQAARSAPAGGAVWLVGWSLGGMLAMEAAAALRSRCPQGVAGLVLLASTARMCAADNWPGTEPKAVKAMKLRLRRDTAGQLADFAALSISAPPGTQPAVAVRADMTSSPSILAAGYAQTAAQIPQERLLAGLDYLLNKDLRPLLPALQDLPVTILHGTADAIIPYATAHATAALLPGAQVIALENAPHALPLTHPSAIISAIRSAVRL